MGWLRFNAGQIDRANRAGACVFAILDWSRMLLSMATLYVIESSALHIREIEDELHFSGNILDALLIVPSVIMPVVKVSLRGN